ncbi:J domain-containing protein [candidate division KSB1 bacterium]|nr:J domain-containing protein [candidate division KSB1 bacterium]
MAKNYYFILGINSDASIEQIKTAYRQRVMEYHPDHYGENCTPFLAVQEAYATLSDPQRRQNYDRSIRRKSSSPITEINTRRHDVEPLIPEQQPIHMQDVSLTRSFDTYFPSFDEMFDRLWNNFSGRSEPKSNQLKSLTVEIPISPYQAARGGMFRILVPLQRTCTTCHGRGGVGAYSCWLCAGEGFINQEFPVSVSVPAGINDRSVIQIHLDRYGIHNFYLTIVFQISDQL